MPIHITKPQGTVRIYETKAGSFEIRYRAAGSIKRETAPTKEKAMTRAAAILDQLQHCGTPMTEAEIQEYRMCERYLGIYGFSLMEAVQHYIAFQPQKTVTVAVAVCEYVSEKESLARVAHIEMILNRLPIFARLQELTSREICEAINPISPVTYNNELATFRAFFNWCIRKGYLTKNPADAISKKPVPVTDPVPMKADDFQKLLHHAIGSSDYDLLRLITLSGLLGLRNSEAYRVRYSDFEYDDGELIRLNLPSAITKTKKRRSIDLPKKFVLYCNLFEGLDSINTVVKTPKDVINKRLSRVCAELGINRPKNGLRKGCISHRIALGHSIETVARESGHSPEVLQTYYQGLVSKEDAEKWFSIPTPQQHATT